MIELNQLINADCIDIMKDIPDKYFELAIVDPPYGIKRDKGFGGFGGFGKPIKRTEYKGDWDSVIPKKEYFEELFRVANNIIIFGGNFFTHLLPQSNHWVFWDKLNTMPTFGDGELIYTNIERNSVKKYTLEYNGLLGKEKDRFHPTQKPVQLYRWLLKNYAKQGDKILDTHAGSCSSVIACIDYGFQWLAIEKDEDYYKQALKRIEKESIKQKLFA